MAIADLNELCESSYNELRRIGFIEDKDKEMLTQEDIDNINDKVYQKIGDLLLNQCLKYNKGEIQHMDFTFNSNAIFTQLIMFFTLCYVNNMDLNNYFQIKV